MRISYSIFVLACILLGVLCQATAWASEDPKTQADALLEEALRLGKDELDKAGDLYHQALNLYEESGDLHSQALCWLFLATIEDQREQAVAAEAYLAKSLPLLRQEGDLLGTWLVLTLSAESSQLNERQEAAREQAREALATMDQIASTSETLDVRTMEAYGKQSYCPNAENWHHLAEVPAMLRKSVFLALRGINLRTLAGSQRALGQREEALATYGQFLDVPQTSEEWTREALDAALALARELGRSEQTRQYLEAHLANARESKDWRREITALRQWADFEASEEQPQSAIARLEQALELVAVMGDIELEAKLLRQVAEIHQAAGRLDQAETLRTRARELERSSS